VRCSDDRRRNVRYCHGATCRWHGVQTNRQTHRKVGTQSHGSLSRRGRPGRRTEPLPMTTCAVDRFPATPRLAVSRLGAPSGRLDTPQRPARRDIPPAPHVRRPEARSPRPAGVRRSPGLPSACRDDEWCRWSRFSLACDPPVRRERCGQPSPKQARGWAAGISSPAWLGDHVGDSHGTGREYHILG
jgi:hypothetical protein